MSIAPSIRQRLFRLRPDDALPLSIEHQRIYILPTARGCAFVATLLLMLVASVNYALSLGYALCFLLTGLFVSSLLHTYRSLAGLQVTEITATKGFAGERLPFTVTLDQTDGRAHNAIELKTRDGNATTIVDVIDDSTAGVATLFVPAQQRGLLRLGRLTLSSTWPLGLWRAWSYVHAPASAVVWPTPEADAPPLPLADSDAGNGRRKPTLDGDVSGLREWVPGDSPSRILWKHIARGNDPHVRLLDAASSPAQAELALSQTRLSSLEAQLSRLSAWVLSAEKQGSSYSVKLPSLSLDANHGMRQRTAALDALALHGLESG